ncbi:hypothetical protein CEXT_95361 [Caerostris extrusa]|uniref:Uncharacterized protein n=1 Tax=Caerostris extrusa TaxID=172846 RepID=A0AAV4XVU0_CAEEX|nr:hypothetical protein CEXT_95361 [Caerostris extrusa]
MTFYFRLLNTSFLKWDSFLRNPLIRAGHMFLTSPENLRLTNAEALMPPDYNLNLQHWVQKILKANKYCESPGADWLV